MKLRATLVTAALVAALLPGAALESAGAAPGDDQVAKAMLSALTDPGGVADFVDGLASVGAFGQQLPGLTLVPGGPDGIGLADLLAQALDAAEQSGGPPDSVASLAQLLSATNTDLNEPAPKRRVRFNASATTSGTESTLDMTMTSSRLVSSGIRLSTKDKPFVFTSAGGLTVRLEFTAHLKLHYDEQAQRAWLEADPAVSLQFSLPTTNDLTKVDAAIGILGVTLTSPSTYQVSGNLTTSVRDPSNDGELSLGANSEIGAKGSSAGLSTVTLDRGAHLAGDLHIVPSKAAAGITLPAISVDVQVASDDLAVHEPTASYADGALDPVAAFQTVTPTDLANAVSGLANTVRQLQHAKTKNGIVDIDLPYLHGTIADIIPAGEALDQFLADHVHKVGDTVITDFASLQRFFTLLSAETGPAGQSIYEVAVSDAAYDTSDASHPQLRFTIRVHRDDTHSQAADPAAEALSGGPDGVTIDDNSLTDANNPGWADPAIANSLKGHQVIVGGSTALIAGVQGSTLLLDGTPLGANPGESFWKGGTPPSDVEYYIAGADPKTGNVEFGNLFKPTAHLRNANAVRPQATIMPSYNLTLPVVLDLSPVVSGPECATVDPLQRKCPFEESVDGTPNGTIKRVVTELPRRQDRVKLVTGGNFLSYDAALLTDVNARGSVGYVPVAINGPSTLGLSMNNAVTLTAKQQQPAAQTLPALFNLVRDNPDGAVSGPSDIGLQMRGDLYFEVVGNRSFFGSDRGHTQFGGPVGQPFVPPTINDGTGDLQKLAVLDVKPGQDDALFAILRADLSALRDGLTRAPSGPNLDTPIPFLGTSFGQSFSADQLSAAVNAITASEPADLVELIDTLTRYLGPPPAGDYFAVDTTTSPATLLLNLDWTEHSNPQVPVQVNLQSGAKLVGVGDAGRQSLSTENHIRVGLNIPLATSDTPASAMRIAAASTRDVRVRARIPQQPLSASAGAVQVQLGGANAEVDADLRLALGDSVDASGDVVQLSQWLNHLTPSSVNEGTNAANCASITGGDPVALCAHLDTHQGATDLGALEVTLPKDAPDLAGALAANVTDPPGLAAAVTTSGLDGSALADGTKAMLETAEQGLDSAGGGGIPVAGDKLADETKALEEIKNGTSALNVNLSGPNPELTLDQAAGNLPHVTSHHVTPDCPATPCDGSTVKSLTLQATFEAAVDTEIPLDLGLPGLSLHAEQGVTGVKAHFALVLHLTVTLDRTKGVTFGNGNDVSVQATADLPDDLTARLSFLKVSLHNLGSGHALEASFGATLKCADCSAAQFAGSPVSALFDISAAGSWNVDELLSTALDPALPGLTARFTFAGTFGPGGVNVGQLQFGNVRINAGCFLSGVVANVAKELATATKPLQPILDMVTAPIPVLSDLSHLAGGGDVTLITLADAFGQGGKTVHDVIDVLKAVSTFINTVSGFTCTEDNDPTHGIPLGDLVLDANLAKSTAASPATADALVGTSVAAGSVTDNPQFNGALAARGKAGLAFPALDNPREIFRLLAGGDATLATFDSGTLALSFSMQEEFGPVYAPPPVMVVVGGSASVGLRVVAGFDTFGLRRAFETGRDVEFLNSLFFKTTGDNGAPIPVVTFTGTLFAGGEVSIFAFKAGITGGIKLTVNFTWNDPNADGKFRYEEFLASALHNPICLFNVGGALSLVITVFITIGISPFDVSFDFTLLDMKLLDFSIKPNCNPAPPQLGRVDNNTLYLYAGVLGGDKFRGAPWGATDDESWIVRQNADRSIRVQALGFTQDFPAVNTVELDGRGFGHKLTALFQGSDTGVHFTSDVVVFGGTADDTIRTDTGRAVIDGGGGNDVITTGDRPDVTVARNSRSQYVFVAGDGGADRISVGNENDEVHGDSHLNFSTLKLSDTDVVNPATPVPSGTEAPAVNNGDPGPDTITLGLGGDAAFGGGGDDHIGVSADSPRPSPNAATAPLMKSAGVLVFGNDGSDSISTGSGNDLIFTGESNPGVHFGPSGGITSVDPDEFGSDDPQSPGGHNTVDTGTGTDWVIGADAPDFIVGHSLPDQVDHLYGFRGRDFLIGGDGTDSIYGGRSDDYLIAQPSTVDLGHTVPEPAPINSAFVITRLPDPNPAARKTLVGGGGTDRIFGGDGPSTIYGDHEIDACKSAGPDPSDPPDEHTLVNAGTNSDGPDLILGGNGVDTVQGGGLADWIYTFGADDVACGGAGDDHVYGGDGADTAFGGTGDDVLQGDDGDDRLYGNAGGDHLYGNVGADRLQGNADDDFLFGGQDDDQLIGGTTTAGRVDGGDYLRGDTGSDVAIGDNGDPAKTAAPVFDLLANDATLGDPDWIFGGGDADTLYGGIDNDHIYGGDANDYIEGNNDQDVIFGQAGADNIVGGSAQQISGVTMPDAGDTISGGGADDVVLGDNGSIDGSALDPVLTNRGLTRDRHIALYDTGNTGAVDGTKSGNDIIDGNDGPDAIFGEGGQDTIHGDSAGSSAAFEDYVEGGQAADRLYGDGGQDDLVGGSYHPQANGAGDYDANDVISGGPDGDVVLGDNGLLTRIVGNASKLTKGRFNTDGGAALTLRSIDPYDQGDAPVAGTSGGDLITGDDGGDVILGERGNDRIQGNGDSDYVEGDTGRDWIEGNAGADDLVGGATYTGGGVPAGQGQLDGTDVIFGGDGDDLELGDNAIVNRIDAPNPLTRRIDNTGAPIPGRAFTLLDLAAGTGPNGAPTRAVYGGDLLSGGGGTDVILGQDGDDQISGGADDDYAEGNGGHDTVWGDNQLAASLISAAQTAASAPGAPDGLPAGPSDPQDAASPNGQDDLMGGSSIVGFRDVADEIHGDGGADYELGDNGTIVRDVLDKAGNQLAATADLFAAPGPLSNRVYTKRYAATLPLGAAYVRHGDASLAPTTRFCAASGTTCEPTSAFGGDSMWGDAGDDTLYGQDGNDLIYGDNGVTAGVSDGDSMVLTVDSTNDDDMFGELGDDRMWGEAGNDAMLGDRGGVVDLYENGSRTYSVDVTQVPKVHYDGFVAGTVTRATDLQHDVNGDVFVAGSTAPKMPHPGDVQGGNDRLRGGDGEDSVHGGFGDDLANGDSGGDAVFGDDGADVLWGGKGCDAAVDTQAVSPDCYANGVFDPNARGAKDRMVDYLVGGKGATSGPTVDPNTGFFGADIIDWHPRGVYGVPDQAGTCSSKVGPETFGNGSTKNPLVTVDPCSWFEMTNLTDADVSNNQHHQGIDWQYGGWDRDVLQGDVADNGPNAGDRLLDWTGAYNLYTHCNSAYGGYNDVRQHSPDWQNFLQQWVFSLGAGQVASDAANGSAGVGTSAFDELALVYPGVDNAHGSGSAFPTTPGHFDNPNACAP